jgi:hypothetical protein
MGQQEGEEDEEVDKKNRLHSPKYLEFCRLVSKSFDKELCTK